jgi:hypothetical protein
VLKVNHGIKLTKNEGYFCNFPVTAQSKELSFGRTFAQSGHPGYNASVVKIYCATNSMRALRIKLILYIFFFIVKNPAYYIASFVYTFMLM